MSPGIQSLSSHFSALFLHFPTRPPKGAGSAGFSDQSPDGGSVVPEMDYPRSIDFTSDQSPIFKTKTCCDWTNNTNYDCDCCSLPACLPVCSSGFLSACDPVCLGGRRGFVAVAEGSAAPSSSPGCQNFVSLCLYMQKLLEANRKCVRPTGSAGS